MPVFKPGARSEPTAGGNLSADKENVFLTGDDSTKSPTISKPASPNDRTLVVDLFHHIPRLNFGNVPVGTTAMETLTIRNPKPFADADLTVERITKDIGFFVDLHSCLVPPNGELSFTVGWRPSEPGPHKCSLQFKLNKKFRLQVTLYGTAMDDGGHSLEGKKRRLTRDSSARSSLYEGRNPLRRLSVNNDISLRSSRTSVSSTPIGKGLKRTVKQLPSQTSKLRRILYDDRWMEKQEEGFTNWINYTLVSSSRGEDFLSSLTSAECIETPAAAKKNQLSVLARTQSEASIRHRAFELYHSSSTDEMVYNIEREITEDRLAIRMDRELHVDVGLKQSFLELLLSYHPSYLRLGMEMVMGEIILPNIPYDMHFENPKQLAHAQRLLKRCILQQFLDPPASKLANIAKKTSRGMYSKAYVQEIHRNTLHRFLMLVYILDEIRMNNLLPTLPCLFLVKQKKYKSSASVLKAFCMEFLYGEGNLLRHLSMLGYTVLYKQSQQDEYDLHVSNLAVDLRDGVRLVKLVETLTGSTELSQSLRLPTVSRLQKIHNVDVALRAMSADGIRFNDVRNVGTRNFTARDIVDGHREKTLWLLWKLISNYKLYELIDESVIESEIRFLVRSMTTVAHEHFQAQERRDAQEQDGNYGMERDDTRLRTAYRLLLRWCRAVCCMYGVSIRNFTGSFSDGRALCFIIHFYHPKLLCKREILPTSHDLKMQQLEEQNSASVKLSPVQLEEKLATHSFNVDPRVFKRITDNERTNFRLANDRVKDLGNVPMLVPEYDSVNLPEEKVIFTFVSYLQSRLFDSRKEIRASFHLQRWWRRIFLRRVRMREFHAALKIQRAWCSKSSARLMIRRCRRILHSARTRDAFLLMACRRICFLRMRSKIIVLQCLVRSFLAHIQTGKLRFARLLERGAREAEKKETSAIKVQCCARQFLARVEMSKRVQRAREHRESSILRIQTQFRVYLAQREAGRLRFERFVRERQERETNAAVSIQTAARRLIAQRVVAKMQLERRVWQGAVYEEKRRTSCVKIQSILRMYGAQRKLNELRFVRLLQIRRAEEQEQERFELSLKQFTTKVAARKVENFFQQVLHRKKREIIASVCIQSSVRGFLSRCKFAAMSYAWNRSAVVIQTRVRTMFARHTFLQTRTAVCKIQAVVRGFLAKRVFLVSVRKVVVVQSMVRKFMARDAFLRQKRASIEIQVAYRSHLLRKYLLRCENEKITAAAKRIQCFGKTFLVKVRLAKQKQAAIRLQARWRHHLGTIRTLHRVHSLAVIRRAGRGYLYRQRAAKSALIRAAVCTVQSHWRHWLCQRKLVRLRDRRDRAVVMLQKVFRGVLARRQIEAKWRCLLRLQMFFRAKLTRKRFHRTRCAVLVVQSAVRRYLNRLRVAEWNRAARLITQVFRVHCDRSIAARKLCAAVILQKNVRRMIAMRSYYRSLANIVECQRLVRGLLVRRRIEHVTKSTVVVQSVWRRYTLRCRWMECVRLVWCIEQQRKMDVSALKMTCFLRACGARLRFLKMKCAAVRIEKCVRRCLAHKQRTLRIQSCVILQRAVRSFLAKNDRNSQQKSAVSIQALWRAYRIRSVVLSADNRNGIVLRQHVKKLRVLEAQALSEPSRLLKHRFQDAFRVIFDGSMLSEVVEASMTLDVCTRYSDQCCRFCFIHDEQSQSESFFEVVFSAIQSCNRSLPSMELVQSLLQILKNLTKYTRRQPQEMQSAYLTIMFNTMDDTSSDDSREDSVLEATRVHTLVDLLHMHRDHRAIFTSSAALLQVALTLDIGSSVKLKVKQRLERLQQLMERRVGVSAATAAKDKTKLPATKASSMFRKLILRASAAESSSSSNSSR